MIGLSQIAKSVRGADILGRMRATLGERHNVIEMQIRQAVYFPAADVTPHPVADENRRIVDGAVRSCAEQERTPSPRLLAVRYCAAF
jgi:hypothetical protein